MHGPTLIQALIALALFIGILTGLICWACCRIGTKPSDNLTGEGADTDSARPGNIIIGEGK